MRSCCEENSSGIDASSGSLVWVRRRNGSWWPGRVLGPDELPAKCSTTPRSGTPIKLLGREDGSIDWYNLETSTRVKAFRCGEYDECIESAKAYAARSSRKASNEGKYVRREDAILHALKLEKLRYSDGSHCSERCNSIITADDDSVVQFKNMCGHVARKREGIICTVNKLEENSAQGLSQSAVSFEEPSYQNTAGMQFMQKKRRKTPNDSEDYDTEGIKRIRGLQDLGLGMVTKKEQKMLVPLNKSHRLSLVDAVPFGKSSIHNGFCNVHQTDTSDDYCSYLRQKRSRAVQLYEKFQKKCRRRPVTKLMEGSTKVPMSSFCHWSSIGQSSLQGVTRMKIRPSKSIDAKQSDYAPVINNSSGCSGTSSEEVSMDASENTCNAFDDDTHSRSELKVNECLSRTEFIDTDCSHGRSNLPAVRRESSIDFPHTSDLYLSGKHQSAAVRRQSNHCSQLGLVSQFKDELDECGSTSCSTQVNHVRHKIDNICSHWTSKGRKHTRYASPMDRSPKDTDSFNESLTTDDFGQLKYASALEDVGNVSQIHLQGFTTEVCIGSAEAVNGLSYAGDYEALFTGHVPVSTVLLQKYSPNSHINLIAEPIQSMPADFNLYDVELNVQASYHGPRVPLVSLTSKLNGKSIIGHPVVIEILEGGQCDALLSGNNCHPAASCVEQLHRNGSGTVGTSQPKISEHLMSKSPLLKKLPNNRKQGFSPRKIRSLSSLTVNQKEKRKGRKLMVEKTGGPVVACVPLRLVFSRLNEAVVSLARPAI